MHHAYVIEGENEAGISEALRWTERELGLVAKANPDVIVSRHSLFSVDDARRISTLASQSATTGQHKVIVISATRLYHESQNALLKLFEEPAPGLHLFLVLPSLGGLLPTLKSRVQTIKLKFDSGEEKSEVVQQFISATPEKRSAIIKKLTIGKDDESKRANRDEAILILNGIENAAAVDVVRNARLLEDVATLRGFLHDRSAPVKMILEHLSIVTPKGLAG